MYFIRISERLSNIRKYILHLHFLQEFDSFGLPLINMENPIIEILKDVVKCSRDLAQIHRNTLNIIQDNNIQNVAQRNRHKELFVCINCNQLLLY